MDSSEENSQTKQCSSLFNWSKESTQRRQIIKTPLPQKRRKTDDDATDNDEELGSSNWLLHENR